MCLSAEVDAEVDIVYGALNPVAVAGLAWLTVAGFVSLWCAWAAVTSVIIALHLRAAGATEAGPLALPAPLPADGS
jgi:hypothetical protein